MQNDTSTTIDRSWGVFVSRPDGTGMFVRKAGRKDSNSRWAGTVYQAEGCARTMQDKADALSLGYHYSVRHLHSHKEVTETTPPHGDPLREQLTIPAQRRPLTDAPRSGEVRQEEVQGFVDDLRAGQATFNKAARELARRGVEVEAHVNTFPQIANCEKQVSLEVGAVNLKL